ncbi:unnamed protein product [Urochloa decumbens]|uniref:Uncharacterized protein n=1 Tax=Urochloa decumbens TaxID=240449 RepID=A0ABC9AYS6_9POAL
MILVTLLFIPLAAVLLCRLPAATPEPAAPASSPAAAGHGPTLRQSVPVVWTVSLLICSYLSFWIYTFSRTKGAAAVFLRVSYAAALAYAAAGLAGPATGVAAAHLATAWAAGLLGYALAEHRMRDGGGERAAVEAAARTPAVRREGQELSLIHGVFMSTQMTLFLAAIVVWLVGLSLVVWWIIFFWATVVNLCFLHRALIFGDFLTRVVCCHIGSVVLGFLCALEQDLWFRSLPASREVTWLATVPRWRGLQPFNAHQSCLSNRSYGSPFRLVFAGCVRASRETTWLWVYYFGLEMMAMAAFFGYTLAVNDRCKEILSRDQPLEKDLELGGVVQESISFSLNMRKCLTS